MTTEERKTIIDGIPGIEIVEGGGVWIKRLPLDLLVDAKENPRRIKKANRKALDGMLAEFGLVDVLQYNLRTGELVGGHQRIDWLRRSGVTEVAVAVLDLDVTRQRALNIGLNNPRAQGSFTDDVTGILAQISPVMPKLYQDTGLAALVSRATINTHERTTLNVDSDDDDEEDADPEFVCEFGDVFDLGGSRLVIGDSTVDETIDLAIAGLRVTCVVTDPPYAIYGSSTGVASDIVDDAMVRPFFEAVLRQCARVLPLFGHAYLCCDWRSWSSIWESAKRAKMSPKNMLIWDKGGGGLGSNYNNAHELVFFCSRMPEQKSITSHRETGVRAVNKSNILRYSKPTGDERLHNAAKPVGMMQEFIANSSDEGDAILDMFGGSGSTLIAAHALGRRCAILEKDPGRGAVIITRFARKFGIRPIRITRAPST